MAEADPKLQAMMAKINSQLTQPMVPPPPVLPSGSANVQPAQAPPSQVQPLQAGSGVTQPLQAPAFQAPPPTLQAVMQGGNPTSNMEGYFAQQTGAVLQQNGVVVPGNEGPSRTKVLTVGAITAGATFLVAFVILVATKPRFVIKKTRNDKGVQERKTNVLAIFIISLVLALVVFFVACACAFKKK